VPDSVTLLQVLSVPRVAPAHPVPAQNTSNMSIVLGQERVFTGFASASYLVVFCCKYTADSAKAHEDA